MTWKCALHWHMDLRSNKNLTTVTTIIFQQRVQSGSIWNAAASEVICLLFSLFRHELKSLGFVFNNQVGSWITTVERTCWFGILCVVAVTTLFQQSECQHTLHTSGFSGQIPLSHQPAAMFCPLVLLSYVTLVWRELCHKTALVLKRE